MERLAVRKKYTLTENTADALQAVITEIIKKSPLDFQVAIFAGCKLSIARTAKTITLETMHPISILKDLNGRVLHVFEMHPDHPKYFNK